MSDGFDASKDRREYQRLSVNSQNETGISLQVVDYGPAFFFDMSYRGAALSQPQRKKITKVGELITLDLKSSVDHGQLKAKVVRVHDTGVGVHFKDVGPTTQVIIDRLVTDRIVGMNMKRMNPEDFGPQSDFDCWFHGPKGTNIYLWTENDFLSKVHFEMSSVSVIYEDDIFIFENKEGFQAGVVKLNNQQIARKALAILQEMDMEFPPLLEFHDFLKDQIDA